MLTDKIRINGKAGKGGNGGVAFGRNLKPTGGDGGKGGDIVLVGSENIYDLSKLRHVNKYIAQNGEVGGRERANGKAGEDLIINVPITTIILDVEGNELGRIVNKGETYVIVKGGKGGLGNYNFKHGQKLTLKKFTPGQEGEEFEVLLELRLVADIIFIGFPNAGKSSMLNMLTNTDVKVAPYPFTTLEPYQGVCDGMLLMDLPGLIEGAHQGKGVGIKFKKHTEYTKAIAHFISLESEDLIGDYKKIRQELKEIDDNLYNKPEFIVLSKSDMFDEDYIKQKEIEIKKLKIPYVITSAYDFEEMSKVKEFFKKQIKL